MNNCVEIKRSVAGLVMQSSGNPVELNILELTESPWSCVGIFHTSMGSGVADGEGIRPETEPGTD